MSLINKTLEYTILLFCGIGVLKAFYLDLPGLASVQSETLRATFIPVVLAIYSAGFQSVLYAAKHKSAFVDRHHATLSLSITGITTLPLLCAHVNTKGDSSFQPYLVYLLNAVARGPASITLISFWACSLGVLFVFMFLNQTPSQQHQQQHQQRKPEDGLHVVIHRKIFHFFAVFIFAPGLVFQPELLSMLMGLMLLVFVQIEITRTFAKDLLPASHRLDRALHPYLDDKDLSSTIVKSHVYLLLGCALPLWTRLSRHVGIHLNFSPQLYAACESELCLEVLSFAGLATVGIGDSLAAICGKVYGGALFGFSRLQKNQKSLEGLFANILSQLVFYALVVAALCFYTEHQPSFKLPDLNKTAWLLGRLFIICSIPSTIEFFVKHLNDNLVLPLVACLTISHLM